MLSPLSQMWQPGGSEGSASLLIASLAPVTAQTLNPVQTPSKKRGARISSSGNAPGFQGVRIEEEAA